MNTKEFAALCHVEKRTLFYYDEIGLLKPIYRDENDYREYDPSQAETMDAIKMLQAAEFSLDEIKLILASADEARIKELKNGLKKTASKIDQLVRISNYFENKMDLYEEFQEEEKLITKNESLNIKILQEVSKTPGQKFNYTNFKLYNGFYWDNDSLYLYSFDKKGDIRYKGETYSFFAKIPAKAFRLVLYIEEQRERFNIPEDYVVIVQQIPHMLYYKDGEALIKVTYIPSDGLKFKKKG